MATVGVYSKQALVLVNYGGACQSELLQFATWIQDQIRAHYDVPLHIEAYYFNRIKPRKNMQKQWYMSLKNGKIH